MNDNAKQWLRAAAIRAAKTAAQAAIGIIVSIINGINRIFFILLSLFNVKLPVTKLRGMVQPGCRRFTDIYTPIMDFDGRVKILKRKELYL